LVLVLSVPLFVAAVKLSSPRWYPLGDFAMTELRVRDVWSSHPPLIGLSGRIGTLGPDQGSHPGPLSFYALFPVWKLLGSSAASLLWANVALNMAAITAALWLGFRRGGTTMLLAIGAALAVLMRLYGSYLLAVPWNPYLCVLWWFVFLVSVWSVFDNDFVALPVAAFAGTLCMQTHISYLGLVGGLGAFTVGVVLWTAVRHPNDEAARSMRRWGLIAVAIVVVAWIPPLIDQFVHSPGNLRTIERYFSSPPGASVGLHDGVRLVFRQLNPFKLFGPAVANRSISAVSVRYGQVTINANVVAATGSVFPGIALVVIWLVSVFGACRRRAQKLVRLDLVLAVSLVLGVLSAARIVGFPLWYLSLWAWSGPVLMLLAIGWTIVVYASARGISLGRAVIALPVVIALAIGSLIASASGVGIELPRESKQMAALVPPTVAALHALPRQARRGPYVITANDAYDSDAVTAETMALLNELLRNGFDARLPIELRSFATRNHAIADPARAALQLDIATGGDISYWRADPRYRELAYEDSRTDAERAEYGALRTQIISELDRAGLKTLDHYVDTNPGALLRPTSTLTNGRTPLPPVPPAALVRIAGMISLGYPAAIFVGPPGKPAGEP
jgi:hypothetical protein